MKRGAIVFIACCFFVVNTGPANWLYIPFRINIPDDSYSVYYTRMCGSGDNVYAAWTARQSSVYTPFDNCVYLNYSHNGGLSWQNSDTLIHRNTVPSWEYGYAALRDHQTACSGDNVYAVWVDYKPENFRIPRWKFPEKHYVLLNYSHDGGKTWLESPDSIRIDPTMDFSTQTQIACEGDNVYVVWLESRDNAGIYFNRSTDRGVTWLGQSIRIDGGAIPRNLKLKCCGDSLYLVWQDYRHSLTYDSTDIYFTCSHDSGTTWLLSETRLNTGDLSGSATSCHPDICILGNNVYVVWNDGRDDEIFGSRTNVYFNRSLDRGSSWMSPDIRINRRREESYGTRGVPQIACEGKNVYVVWVEARKFDGLNRRIFFNYSRDQGATWQDEDTRLDRSGLEYGNVMPSPDLACSRNNVFVTWADYRNGEYDIYVNQSGDGGVNWLPEDVRIDTGDPPGNSASHEPQMVCSNGKLHVVWADYRGEEQFGNLYINTKTITSRLVLSCDDGGKTDPEAGKYECENDQLVTIEAIPANGYGFSHWSGYVRSGESEENPLTIVMDEDKRIHAHFVKKFKLRLGAGKGGTTDPPPGKLFYEIGSSLKVTALPDEGYRFLKWTGDIAKKVNPVNIKMNSNMWVRAQFLIQRTLMLHANQGGTTEPAPGSTTHDNGTQIRIEARPEMHYEFAGWSGDVNGASNPCAFTLWEDKSVSALFRRMIYAPVAMSARRVENRSLSFSEYLDILQWGPNPGNADILKYHIYRWDGTRPILIAEVDADTYRFQSVAPAENVSTTYSVCAVNSENREGEWATATVERYPIFLYLPQ